MLTERDYQILRVLTQKVRVLGADQVARTWFAGTRKSANARGSLGRLQRLEFVRLKTAMLHPEITPSPLFTHKPGGPEPDFQRLAWTVNRRWHLPPRRTLVAFPTDKARRLLGSPGDRRAVRDRELLHDIHVASIYLTHFHPDEENRWSLEDELIAHGYFEGEDNIPDAIVRGKTDTIVEFGGAYSAPKLRRIHEAYCNARYEIW